MKNKIKEMLELQDKMNSVVNPNWTTAGYKWPDAILVESTEAMEHFGWKWWKKQTPNLDAVKMELVDIWHFALSMSIENSIVQGFTRETLIEDMADFTNEVTDRINAADKNDPRWTKATFIDCIRQVAGQAATGGFDYMAFRLAMAKVDMTFDELYTQYVAKNCLNIFRQENGYKTGTYIKDWSKIGYAEDNDCLVDLLKNIPEGTESVYGYLHSQLGMKYRVLSIQ